MGKEIKFMFRGINMLNLDPKGRISIPTRYREVLTQISEGQLVLTIDTEQRCLLMYPLSVWEKIEAKISTLPSFHPATRRIQRLLIGHATELLLDAHGRVLLPPLLRDYAGLAKRVVLLGQGEKFELWDEMLWEASRKSWLSESIAKEDLPPEMQLLSL